MTAPALPPGLRDRLLQAAAREPAARAGWARRLAVGFAFAALWMGGLFGVLGLRPDWAELPLFYSAGTVLSVGLGAGLLTLLGTTRGKAMLGAPVGLVLGVTLVLPLALAAWLFLVTGRGPSTVVFASEAEAIRHSASCDALSFLLGVPVLAGLLFLRRGLRVPAPSLVGACLGAAAGAWAHMVVHAHCPIGNVSHLMIGHLLPMLPLMALGALFGYRALR